MVRRGPSLAFTHREQIATRSLPTAFPAAAPVRLMGGSGSKNRTSDRRLGSSEPCRDTPSELLPVEATRLDPRVIRSVNLQEDEIEVGEEPTPYLTSRCGGAVEMGEDVRVVSLLPRNACREEYPHTCYQTVHLREQSREIVPTHKYYPQAPRDKRLRGGGGVETVESNREVQMNRLHSRTSRRGEDLRDLENATAYRTEPMPVRAKHFREMESELGDHPVEHTHSQKLSVRKELPFYRKAESLRDVEMVPPHSLSISRHGPPSVVGPRRLSSVLSHRSQVRNHPKTPQEQAHVPSYEEQPQRDSVTLSLLPHLDGPGYSSTPAIKSKCSHRLVQRRSDGKYSSNITFSRGSQNESNYQAFISRPCSPISVTNCEKINSKSKHMKSKHMPLRDERKCSNHVTPAIVKPLKETIKEDKRHVPTKSATSKCRALDVKVLHKRSRSAPPRSSTCFLETDESSTCNIDSNGWRTKYQEVDNRRETRPRQFSAINATDSVHRDATSSNALLFMVPVRSQLTPKEMHEQFCEEIKEKYHTITRKVETRPQDQMRDIDDLPLPPPPPEEALYPITSRELMYLPLPRCMDSYNYPCNTEEPTHLSHNCSRPEVLLRSVSECSSQTVANEKSLAEELSEIYQQHYPPGKGNEQFDPHESEQMRTTFGSDAYYSRKHTRFSSNRSDTESLKSGEFPSYRKAKEIFERKMEEAKKQYDLSLYKFREKQLKKKLIGPMGLVEHPPSPRERRE